MLTGNNEPTMSMSVYARQQLFDFDKVGYGSAASTILFLVIAVIITICLRRAVGRAAIFAGSAGAMRRVKLVGLASSSTSSSGRSSSVYAVFPFY